MQLLCKNVKYKIPVVKYGLTLLIAFFIHSSNSTVCVLHWEKYLPVFKRKQLIYYYLISIYWYKKKNITQISNYT